MYRFVLFLKRIYLPLLFILIEWLAIRSYAQSTPYTRAKLMTASNQAVGMVYGWADGVFSYFGLRKQNTLLTEEVARLKNALAIAGDPVQGQAVWSSDAGLQNLALGGGSQYSYFPARVINNSATFQDNFFTLDKGMRDGVEQGMGVLTPDGVIVGVVKATSAKFAVCMSVLNRGFSTGGRILGEDYTGSIKWEGLSPDYLSFIEVQKYASIEKGDTIVTAFSDFFPPGATIGTVESFELTNATYYEVKVKIATHMTALKNVILVKNRDAMEVETLMQDSFLTN